MNSKTVKKILVIRFSSLGDVLLTTSLLRSIIENYPGAGIHYLTKSGFSGIIQYNPNISRVIEADNDIDFSGLRKLKKEIKAEGYDLIIDAHNNIRSIYLRLFLDSAKHIFKKYSFRKFLMVKLKINLMKDLPPITERYCRIIPQNKFIYSLPEMFTDDDSKLKVEKLLKELNLPKDKKIICIAPSSNHFTKTYTAEYYTELINKFDAGKYVFLLIGKGKDKINIHIIKSNTGANVIDLCDRLNISELAEIIARCSLFIGGDTGPMHIAESLNKLAVYLMIPALCI